MTPTNLTELIEAAAAGQLAGADRDLLESQLRANPETVAEYVAQMRLHALLRWKHGDAGIPPAASGQKRSGRPLSQEKKTRGLRWAVAASLLIGLGLTFAALWRPGAHVVAPVETVAVVLQSEGGNAPAAGSRVAPGALRVEAGEVTLRFDSGTVVTLTGPADAEVIDAMNLRVTGGRLTARLEAGGMTGFTVRTPSAAVVDLSTEFGVSVDGGQTDVVVFEGAVEVTATVSSGTPTRLTRGEALRVEATGKPSRIVSVGRDSGSTGWSARPGSVGVIASVADNLADPVGRKCYQIVRGGLRVGAAAYVDRDYRWVELPPALRGADVVMTFNDDKRQPDLELTVSLARPCRLFVFTDDRSPAPEWLEREGFTATGERIGLRETTPGEPVRPFAVWERRLTSAGDVRLGPNAAKAMYAVAAVPERVRVACLGDSITAGGTYTPTLQDWLGSGYEVRNFGVSGATLLANGDKPYTKEKAYADAVAFAPDVVTVMLGTNDTKPQNYKSVDNFATDYQVLLAPFLKQNPKPRVFLCLPPPVYFDGNFGIDGTRLREGVLPRIKAVAAELKLPVIDVHAALADRPDLFFRDNVHPMGGGAELAAPFYESLTGNKPPVPVPPAPPKQLRVACLGDSITEGSGYPAELQRLLGNRYMVRNFGVSSSTLLAKGDKPYMKQSKFASAKAFAPDAVIVMLGTNDTKPQNYKAIDNFPADLKAFCAEVANWPGKPKVLLALPVPVIGAGNFGIDNGRLETGVLPAIRAVAKELNLPLIEMNAALRGHAKLFKDNVHPVGAQGLMARPAFATLLAAFPPLPVRDELLKNPGAEDGTAGWTTRGGKLEAISDPVRAGKGALRVTGRKGGWHGPAQDVTAALRDNGVGYYHLRGSVRLAAGSPATDAVLVVLVTDARGTRYLKTPGHAVTADGWAAFADDVFLSWSGELKSAIFYIETNGAPDADLFCDELSLSGGRN